MTGYRELSRNRDFTILWTGQTISDLGSNVSMFVFPLVAYALSGSALWAAVVEAATVGPPAPAALAEVMRRHGLTPAP